MRTVTQQNQDEQLGEAFTEKPKEGWLHVRVPRELRKQVNIRAAEEEKSIADVVADALRKHLGMAA